MGSLRVFVYISIDALRFGLVSKVVPDDILEEEVIGGIYIPPFCLWRTF